MKINPSIAFAVASAALIAVSNGAIVSLGDFEFSKSGAGSITANTTSIATAVTYSIPQVTSGSVDGFFTGMAAQSFGPISFTVSSLPFTTPYTLGSSFSFGGSVTGIFTATKVSYDNYNVNTKTRAIVFTGSYAAGTHGGPPSAIDGELVLNLWQSGVGQTISGSGVFSAGFTPIPEPGSALATAGLLAGGMFLRRRKQQA